jgi:hypothetical protein
MMEFQVPAITSSRKPNIPRIHCVRWCCFFYQQSVPLKFSEVWTSAEYSSSFFSVLAESQSWQDQLTWRLMTKKNDSATFWVFFCSHKSQLWC